MQRIKKHGRFGMKLNTISALGLTVLVAGACDSGTLEPLEEESLALSLSGDGIEVMEGHQARPGNWVQRLIRGINQQGSTEAIALLEQARTLRGEAREARVAGDSELFLSLMEQSKASLFEAVILTFPDAPERTGNAVDEAIARITERLGDRDAPRISEVLAEATELRVQAVAALAAGDDLTALDLNFQASRMLTRMVHFIRDGQRRGDREAGHGPRGELSDHVAQMQF
jgi:hypothetical protein